MHTHHFKAKKRNKGIGMPKRALVEHRPWLLISLIAAVAYYVLWNNPIGGVWLILLKGAGVGFLAMYALRRLPTTHHGLDGGLLVVVLTLSALADMALELSFEAGGALFLLAHLVAIGLYLRNRRHNPVISQRMLAIGLLIGTPLIAYLLSRDWMVAVYAAALGAMAAAAWMSRFSRYRVGIGAVLFVMSDWLIFSRMGPISLGELPDIAIWPLYYLGQFLIATGVVQTLRGDLPGSE